MKIISLAASNFARLRAVEIRPTSPVVPIVGKNDQGKSTVLRAIWTALVGRSVAPPQPIHEGAEEAILDLDMGSLRVVRKFGRGRHGELTTELAVTDEDGGRVRKTPQAVIDALLGDLSFDPLEFAKMPPAEQFDRLKALVPGVDFEAIAAARKKAFDERTEANRRAKEARVLAERILLPQGGEPAVVDVAAAMAELSAANEKNAGRSARRARIATDQTSVERMLDEAEELASRAAKLTETAKALQASVHQAEAALNAEPFIDVGPLQERIASAQQVDRARALFAEKRQRSAEAQRQSTLSEELTAAIERLDVQVRDAISKASLPAGITLDLETRTVHMRGLPFAAAGTASRILASAEVAMALNPNLRVMLIDEGSELDRDSMGLLEELAEQRDFQIWICSVDSSESGPGFVIVDGAVASAAAGAISAAVIERSKGRGK